MTMLGRRKGEQRRDLGGLLGGGGTKLSLEFCLAAGGGQGGPGGGIAGPVWSELRSVLMGLNAQQRSGSF